LDLVKQKKKENKEIKEKLLALENESFLEKAKV